MGNGMVWALALAVLVFIGASAGRKAKGHYLGILIDNRNRFSLNRFQLVAWTMVILSTYIVVFYASFRAGTPVIPKIEPELLGLLGISVTTGVVAGAVKSGKDQAGKVGLFSIDDRSFWQIIWEEEGASKDKVVNVTKFQNFIFTVVLIIFYIVLFSDKLGAPELPEFKGNALWLIGISHGAYVTGKIPDKK